MLIAETRPSRLGGVTDCRNVVVEITHRIGPAPSRKKPRPASGCAWRQCRQRQAPGRQQGRSPVQGRIDPPERQALHHPRRRERTNHHADTVHRKRGADAGGRQAEAVHRIGHEHCEQQEGGRIEDELRQEDRPQQGMVKDEGGAFLDFL